MTKTSDKTQTAEGTAHDNSSSGLSSLVGPSLNTLALRTESRRGNFSITDQSISATSTFETNQSLTESDWVWGYMFLWLPDDADIAASHRRKTIFTTFTTDATQAVSQASQVNFQSFMISSNTYNFYEWWYKGYRYNEDTFLSSSDYGEDGSYIRLDSVRIDGSNLEIIFRNTDGSARELTIKGEWRVFRHPTP